MKPEDIKDADSLKAWLQGQTREVALAIAQRAAMRVAPIFWRLVAHAPRRSDLTEIPVARALLTAAVAAKYATPETMKAAAAASSAAGDVGIVANDSARAVFGVVSPGVDAATFSANWAASAAARAGDHIVDTVSEAIAAAGHAANVAVGDDADTMQYADAVPDAIAAAGQSSGQNVFSRTLWPNRENRLEDAWREVRAAWLATNDPGWKFWVDWYDAALAGRALMGDWDRHWALLKDIALEIGPRTWDNGPDAVNPEIALIYARHLGPEQAVITDQESAISLLEERLGRAEIKAGSLEKLRDGLLSRQHIVEENFQAHKLKIEKALSDLQENLENKANAVIDAFKESQAIREPVALWKEKQDEHDKRRKAAYFWFIGGLVCAVLLTIGIIAITIFSPEIVSNALAPLGCDIVRAPELCRGFSFRGLIVSGGVLTTITLLLWFVRLKMKEYLSERHLALDSRERRAFAQALVGLVAEEDGSDAAKEQRAIVYAALFRPSTEGIVKEDGGIDPSIAAAISRFLAGR